MFLPSSSTVKKFLTTFYFSGITTTSSTTTQVKTTEVKTCTEDSLTLQNEIVDRSSIDSLYWKYRFQRESKWNRIAYCKRNLRVTCKLTTEELRDGTKVSIGANESLIVKHSAQSGSRDHIKFLFEAQLTDHTVFNHIFDHFAITCKSYNYLYDRFIYVI